MMHRLPKEWDLFICHASEDKAFVRSLADALRSAGFTLWYDEFTLSMGDSLRRSIDAGLARASHGVVIISPAFFQKEWPQKELDALVARESAGQQLILPVWHGITARQVAAYSPLLADRVASSSSRGIAAIVADICRASGKHPASHSVPRTSGSMPRPNSPKPRMEARPSDQRESLSVPCPRGSSCVGSTQHETRQCYLSRISLDPPAAHLPHAPDIHPDAMRLLKEFYAFIDKSVKAEYECYECPACGSRVYFCTWTNVRGRVRRRLFDTVAIPERSSGNSEVTS